MERDQIIQKTIKFVHQQLENQGAGHDFLHVSHVWENSKLIAKGEKINDTFIIELGALLHDIADFKFHDGNEKIGGEIARKWLLTLELNENDIRRITHIVDNVSFKGELSKNKMRSIEGKIVQDADRLESIGAIGIARCFTYGGSKSIPIYDPSIKIKRRMTKKQFKKHQGTSVNYFYEKLLLLKDLMNTKTAKKIANKRHKYMLNFLKEFFIEWENKG